MKKYVTFIFVALLSATFTNAQDIITKKDGADIKAKILEVSSNEVKYKNFSRLDGPIYTLTKNEILMIRYEDGEKEIFNSNNVNTNIINTNKRYSQLNEQYNYRNYTSSYNDRYSVGWCGVASFFIPGLGQAICNEWGRAAVFFFANLTLNTASLIILDDAYNEEYANDANRKELIGLSVLAVSLANNIWSIIDAVHVAKTKNLYFRDLQSMTGLSFKLEPTLALTKVGFNENATVAGLSLKVKF